MHMTKGLTIKALVRLLRGDGKRRGFNLCKFIIVLVFISPMALAAPKLPPTLPNDADNNYDDLLDTPANGRQLSKETKSDLDAVRSSLPPMPDSSESDPASSNAPIVIQHGKGSKVDYLQKPKDAANGDDNPTESKRMQLSVSHTIGNNDINDLLLQAYRALTLGQIESATFYYKKVLELNKEDESARFGLATIYQRNTQEKQARGLYTSILTDNPENQQALNNFLVLVGEEAPENAVLELKRLEAVNPRFSPIPAQIGMIYARIGDLKKAARYLNKAMLLSPENITYRYNLAIVFDRMGQVSQAITLYKDVLEAGENGTILPDSSQKIRERLTFLGAK